MNSLNQVLTVAKTTNAEVIAIALVAEHQDSPTKLKRLLREHIENDSKDIWDRAHAVCKLLQDRFVGKSGAPRRAKVAE